MPFFSVIVPNYNHSKYLKQRIDSILSQSFKDFEIIIIDDCSADGSREIIEAYRNNERVSSIIYNRTNSGSPFRPWKTGVMNAKGSFIWIAESDDFSDPKFLSTAYDAISSYPETGLFFCNSIIVDEKGSTMQDTTAILNNLKYDTDRWNEDYSVKGIDEINKYLQFDCIPYNVSAVVFKKDLFNESSLHLDSFRYIGDWFFFLKVAFRSDIYYSSHPLNYFRRHAESHFHKRSDLVTFKTEYFKILKLLYNTEGVIYKKILLDYFAYYHLSFGLIEDGLIKGFSIINSYYRIDHKLALKIVYQIFSIKIPRKRPASLQKYLNI